MISKLSLVKNLISSTLKTSSTNLIHNPPPSSKPTTTKHNLKALCPSKNFASSTLKTSCTTIHDPHPSSKPSTMKDDLKALSEVCHTDEVVKKPCK